MDLLLSLLYSEKKIEKLQIKILNVIEKIFKNTFEYNLYSNNNLLLESKEYNNSISGSFSLTKFKSLLFSNTILHTYKEVLKDLYNKDYNINEINQNLMIF